MAYDPRLTPARPDLAALHLRGEVEAQTYASGEPLRVAVAAAPMTGAPDPVAEMTNQLLFGEDFTAYEIESGWAWGQSEVDGYVGYVPAADLVERPKEEPTHRVAALQAFIHPEAELKSRPIGAIPFGARVVVSGEEGDYAALNPGGFIASTALVPMDHEAQLWVATAERFLGVPYLWGGRSAAGLDCSGLIQTALHAAGMECPRDSDMQLEALGRDVTDKPRTRGDIVFWKGHVGVMTSPTKILHANAFHMAVFEEPFDAATQRIAKQEFGEIIGARRITH